MPPEKLHVIISSYNGPNWTWEDVAAGWRESASGQLDIEGQTIPDRVVRELERHLEPTVGEGWQIEVPYENAIRYRMTIRAQPEGGPLRARPRPQQHADRTLSEDQAGRHRRRAR